MIKSFISVFFRSLRSRKVYSLISISGLAVGIGCFLLVFLYADFESSYDTFHANSDHIYRVIRECEWDRGTAYRADTGAPMGPMLQASIPSIVNTVRFTSFYEGMVSYEDRRFDEPRVFFTDPSVFEVFTFPLEQGDPHRALQEPFSVVLTPATARKYFGADDPLNKIITYTGGATVDLTVTGVLKEVPDNSHLEFDFLVSFESLRALVPPSFFTSRWDSPTSNYVLLQEGVLPENLDRSLRDFATNYVDKAQCSSVRLRLDPLESIYYQSSNIGGGIWKRGDRGTTNIFLALAVFLLVIAGINYMNLATARSSSRSREIGIRKIMGVQRHQLIGRFLGESVSYGLLALVCGLLLVELLLPAFSQLIGVNLSPDYQSNYLFIATGVAVLVGLFSGSYPAFFLSAFRPVNVLKGDLPSSASASLRKGLVIFQFALSIILMVGAITAFRQMRFIHTKDLGFNKENVVVLPIRGRDMLQQYEVIKNELLKNPHISSVTAASQIPGVTSPNGIQMDTEGVEDVSMPIIYVDFDYVKTLEVDVSAGRPFLERASNDAAEGLLINEAAMRMLGWNEAVGNEVTLYFKQAGQIVPMYDTRIVGITADFNFRMLSMPIQPVLFKIAPNRLRYILARIDGSDTGSSIDYIRSTITALAPDQPFSFSFLDDEIGHAYQGYQTTYTIVQYMTLLAILIACLGLYGLASYMAEKRTKEIGVRKVLGASVQEILMLFIKDVARLVVIAAVIASPFAYFSVNYWLNNFAYRVNISISIFLLAGLAALSLALITISFHSAKAALTDPVNSLRYE